MEEALQHFFSELHPVLLALAIALSLAALAKAADWLVDEAVVLSERSGIPKTVIGATIVSLGTTTPEAAVSVLAAIAGRPGLALGNAVGSVICDTGLILGLACLIAPLRLDPRVVSHQGWIQLIAGFGIVAACFPWSNPGTAFSAGGHLSQMMGFVFVTCLGVYLWVSVRWAKKGIGLEDVEGHEEDVRRPLPYVIVKLLVAVALVVASAQVLIPAVTAAAMRMHVPESIIAATMVAFGTSLPELVTAISAARRGHGELAVGNIIGADILNVLFVSGTAAAVTPSGLHASPYFF
ncbi:MAG: sodium:calcium antiporter [Acidobacteria bacterium]|nr:sodium:calcium antiporter [Acidobacteriota bacterium]